MSQEMVPYRVGPPVEEDQTSALAPRQQESVSALRAAKEVEAAMIVARRFPRDEMDAIAKVQETCRRVGLAKDAEYEYVRGTSRIVGPSIDLMRAIKCRWGNLTSGWTEVSRQQGRSQLYVYAWDMETNARSEITFEVRHWRDTKSGGYPITDERDIYEHLANQASRRERRCLENVIPVDVVQLAREECYKTLKGANTEPLADRVRKMVEAFKPLGVTVQMIEGRLQHRLDAVSENELVSLRRVYTSIRDGVGDVAEHFPRLGDSEAPPAGSRTEQVAEQLSKTKKGKAKPKGTQAAGPVAATAEQPVSEAAGPVAATAEQPVSEAADPGAREVWVSNIDKTASIIDPALRDRAMQAVWAELVAPGNPLSDTDLQELKQYYHTKHGERSNGDEV